MMAHRVSETRTSPSAANTVTGVSRSATEGPQEKKNKRGGRDQGGAVDKKRFVRQEPMDEEKELRAERARADKRARELAELNPRVPSSSFDPHIFVCECTSCGHCIYHANPCQSCKPGAAYCKSCSCDGCYHRRRCQYFLHDGCGRGCLICANDVTHRCTPCRSKFSNVLQWCYHSQWMHPADYNLLRLRMQKLHDNSVVVHERMAGGQARKFYYVRPFYYGAGNVAHRLTYKDKFDPETDPALLNQLQAETSWLNFLKMRSSDVWTAERFLRQNGQRVTRKDRLEDIVLKSLAGVGPAVEPTYGDVNFAARLNAADKRHDLNVAKRGDADQPVFMPSRKSGTSTLSKTLAAKKQLQANRVAASQALGRPDSLLTQDECLDTGVAYQRQFLCHAPIIPIVDGLRTADRRRVGRGSATTNSLDHEKKISAFRSALQITRKKCDQVVPRGWPPKGFMVTELMPLTEIREGAAGRLTVPARSRVILPLVRTTYGTVATTTCAPVNSAVQQDLVSECGNSSEVSRKRKLARKECGPLASRQRHTGRNMVTAHPTVATHDSPRLSVFSPTSLNEAETDIMSDEEELVVPAEKILMPGGVSVVRGPQLTARNTDSAPSAGSGEWGTDILCNISDSLTPEPTIERWSPVDYPVPLHLATPVTSPRRVYQSAYCGDALIAVGATAIVTVGPEVSASQLSCKVPLPVSSGRRVLQRRAKSDASAQLRADSLGDLVGVGRRTRRKSVKRADKSERKVVSPKVAAAGGRQKPRIRICSTATLRSHDNFGIIAPGAEIVPIWRLPAQIHAISCPPRLPSVTHGWDVLKWSPSPTAISLEGQIVGLRIPNFLLDASLTMRDLLPFLSEFGEWDSRTCSKNKYFEPTCTCNTSSSSVDGNSRTLGCTFNYHRVKDRVSFCQNIGKTYGERFPLGGISDIAERAKRQVLLGEILTHVGQLVDRELCKWSPTAHAAMTSHMECSDCKLHGTQFSGVTINSSHCCHYHRDGNNADHELTCLVVLLDEDKLTSRYHTVPGYRLQLDNITNDGGIAIEMKNSDLYISIARFLVHGCSPIDSPDRLHPSMMSLTYFQHRRLNEARH